MVELNVPVHVGIVCWLIEIDIISLTNFDGSVRIDSIEMNEFDSSVEFSSSETYSPSEMAFPSQKMLKRKQLVLKNVETLRWNSDT